MSIDDKLDIIQNRIYNHFTIKKIITYISIITCVRLIRIIIYYINLAYY